MRVVNFNPLPRKEGDFAEKPEFTPEELISIHSLVKRETGFYWVTSVSHVNFNPLPRKEGDG